MSKWCCGVPPARPPPSESVKASVTRHHSCIVSITGIRSSSDKDIGTVRGVGVLIHPTLVLTTHSTIPSVSSIKDAKITVCRDIASLSYVERKFMPEIFFQSDADLDLTVVSCELIEVPGLDDTLPLHTAKLSRRALRKNRNVFVMGCHTKDPEDVVILEGKIAGCEKADRLSSRLWFRTGEDPWMPGSAGFDEFGTFAFIVTTPPPAPPAIDRQGQLGGRGPSHIDIAQNSTGTLGDLFSNRKPKAAQQWGSSIQIIKDWVEPLWRANRNEVFEGPHPAADQLDPVLFRRLSLQAKEATHGTQKSVKDAAVTVAIRQATLHDVMAVDRHTSKSGVSTSQQREKPLRARTSPPNVTAIRETRAKKGAFDALKKNKGTNRAAANKRGQGGDDVSVQTELLVTEADHEKPLGFGKYRSAAEDRAGERRKGRRRERWSLPAADGHALDFLRDDRDITAWTAERHYAGMRRSQSEHPSRAGSAGATPPRHRRHVVSDGEEEAASSMTRSLLRTDSVYFKPTVSYMQKRNLTQRDAILARQATSNILPRWSS